VFFYSCSILSGLKTCFNLSPVSNLRKEIVYFRKEIVYFHKEIVHFRKEIVYFRKEIVHFCKEITYFRKEIVHFRKEIVYKLCKKNNRTVLIRFYLIFLKRNHAAQ
jgi:uncharacterized coiled-coil DUF342 family protein